MPSSQELEVMHLFVFHKYQYRPCFAWSLIALIANNGVICRRTDY